MSYGNLLSEPEKADVSGTPGWSIERALKFLDESSHFHWREHARLQASLLS